LDRFDTQRATPPRLRSTTELPKEGLGEDQDKQVVTTAKSTARRWFTSSSLSSSSAEKKAPGLNPDAKVFSFTRGRSAFMPSFSSSSSSLTSMMDPPASLGPFSHTPSPVPSSTTASGNFFSSLLAFAPSPAEREALQRALGTNGVGLTRSLSNQSDGSGAVHHSFSNGAIHALPMSPFTSPLPSARNSVQDLTLDRAAAAWATDHHDATPPQATTTKSKSWFSMRKSARISEDSGEGASTPPVDDN